MLGNKNRLLTPDLVKLTKMNVSGRRADEPFIGTSWKAREWRVPDVRKINYPKRYPLELREAVLRVKSQELVQVLALT